MRLLEALLLLGFALLSAGSKQCSPVYVRWPRVKLNVAPAADGAFSLTACKSACTNEEDPLRSGIEQQCSGFNHKQGPNQYTHNCQLFPREKVQHVDGYIEADDRYSYFWKYCVNTQRSCGGDYAFTFLSDRYMADSEVSRLHISSTLEECLAECLNEKAFLCRSVSFNRTDGGCHLSQQNQLSKPSRIKLNNNPNFRIDYYENNCYNISDSFQFDYKCEEKGIRVSVKSKFPYSGALYGLYDFFSCRIEPKEETEFGHLFPYPTQSKNCSDSIRYKGNDMVLEVVLSTDGVEPLYFITPDDLTFQARCPIRHAQPSIDSSPFSDSSVSNESKSTAEFAASAHALFSMLANSSVLAESRPVVIQKTVTKDTFPLPLVTTTTAKPHKSDAQKGAQTKKPSSTTSSTTTTTSAPSTTPSTTVTTSTVSTNAPSTKETFPLSSTSSATPSSRLSLCPPLLLSLRLRPPPLSPFPPRPLSPLRLLLLLLPLHPPLSL
uniref:Apple domain-containing protein n=1 Tax=Steinernema glaseri TaxID=37863 RepID=A0A1I7Z6J2_9BILA